MKHDLRRVLLTQRQAMDPGEKERHDAALCARLLAWCAGQPVTSIGLYWPIRGEPDLQAAYGQLAQRGIRLALPVVLQKDAPLVFAAWVPGDAMESGAMKVPIPAQPHRLVVPQMLLIPCVGFNRGKMRLGYGGGFYDRTLAQVPRPLAIGIAYQQAQAEFDADAHDIALDLVLTEAQTID